jgi:hypothetical protein
MPLHPCPFTTETYLLEHPIERFNRPQAAGIGCRQSPQHHEGALDRNAKHRQSPQHGHAWKPAQICWGIDPRIGNESAARHAEVPAGAHGRMQADLILLRG